MQRSLEQKVFQLLQTLKIPVSFDYLKKELCSHPDYPSVRSITDVMDELGIDNAAFQIDQDLLPEVTVPFMVHLNRNGGEFVIVNNANNLDTQFPGFFERWSGTTIIVEKPKGWKHKINEEWLQRKKNLRNSIHITFSVLFFFITMSNFISFHWIQLLLFLIAMAGIFISWMIVSKDLGIENSIADKVCGTTSDCSSIIHSKISKLPFGIGWSDAGIIYFSFLLILSIVGSVGQLTSDTHPVLFFIAVCSIPLTCYSLYYQLWIMKKWCRLCLVTIGLLWAQFVLLLPNGIKIIEDNFSSITINPILLTAFVIFITTASWLWLKPILKRNKELERKNFTAISFKNNADVFMTLLKGQRRIDATPFEADLQLGNPNANIQIIVACNPYCTPCATAHELLHNLVERNDIGLTVRFTINTSNNGDKKLRTVNYILQIVKDASVVEKGKMLHDWYRLMDLEKFKEIYPITKDEETNEHLEQMEQWTASSKILFTPMIFINGREFPKMYSLDDFSRLVSDLTNKIETDVNMKHEKKVQMI